MGWGGGRTEEAGLRKRKMLVSGVGDWGCISCELLSAGKDPCWRKRGRDRGREGERGEKRSKEQRQALGSMASVVARGQGALEVLVSLVILESTPTYSERV